MSVFKKCKDCSDRKRGCHDTCDIYKGAREKFDKQKKYLKGKDAEYLAYHSNVMDEIFAARNKHRSNRRRYRGMGGD